MAGPYAHLTLVKLLQDPRRLEDVDGFPTAAIPEILRFGNYIELGSVSPDYPYLVLGASEARTWADKMHYEKTGQMIHAGIRKIPTYPLQTQKKLLAWLLGYAAHVSTDVTIHPVVELKVGPYAENRKAHRICEMHQDVYIYRRLNVGEIGQAEFLDSGIGTCADPDKKDCLDPDIKTLWLSMLKEVYGNDAEQNSPDIDCWHQGFRFIIDNIAEEGRRLVPFARHIAADAGVTYPKEADDQYIRSLDVPNSVMDYDEIFDLAMENVASVWAMVARGILDEDEAYLAGIGDWNLDTGLDQADNLVFWS